MTHTTKTLRETILNEMESLAAGNITPARARATASLAKAAISTAQFELQHANHIADRGGSPVVVKL